MIKGIVLLLGGVVGVSSCAFASRSSWDVYIPSNERSRTHCLNKKEKFFPPDKMPYKRKDSWRGSNNMAVNREFEKKEVKIEVEPNELSLSPGLNEAVGNIKKKIDMNTRLDEKEGILDLYLCGVFVDLNKEKEPYLFNIIKDQTVKLAKILEKKEKIPFSLCTLFRFCFDNYNLCSEPLKTQIERILNNGVKISDANAKVFATKFREIERWLNGEDSD
jgi:hypothetical protein